MGLRALCRLSCSGDHGIMSNQITVGYDGSGSSSEAVKWAAHEATVRSTRLRIVSCYEIVFLADEMDGWPTIDSVTSPMAAVESSLTGIRQFIATAYPGLVITTEASAGPASIALLDGVEPDDLVVVGASSHEGAAAFWLGNTPRHVVRHSPCPVVVVRGVTGRGRPVRIVVGVDGSVASDRALRWAADEADRNQVVLDVVHGWWYEYLAYDTSSSQARDLTEIDAACVLDHAVESAREFCGAEVIGHLVEASPASALVDSVGDGDLLVLGSRGRGAVKSGLFGSTVNSVLERCVAPVVVVPALQVGEDPDIRFP